MNNTMTSHASKNTPPRKDWHAPMVVAAPKNSPLFSADGHDIPNSTDPYCAVRHASLLQVTASASEKAYPVAHKDKDDDHDDTSRTEDLAVDEDDEADQDDWHHAVFMDH